ncbi:MAG: hypothetical protein JOZ52_01635 [Acidobacteria bacterium]|nr:hypothetical protein [Acidobacteriota bacterium]
MFCPQCGQQQTPGEVRFCSRCGFPLDSVSQLVAHGGVLPKSESEDLPQVSPRRRGVKHGVTMIMLGIVLTILFGVLNGYLGTPELLIALSAVIFFVGGPLRLLYALIFEEGAKKNFHPAPNYLAPNSPAAFPAPPRQTALPPPQQQSIPTFRQPHRTAEINPPPSVTENTTRLLEKEPDQPEH